jgi:CRP/FNR family cyclic AMP-dependent transcriptional regulator
VAVDWAVLRGLAAEDQRKVLQAARRRRFARHEVVFHEGDPGDTLHLLARGRVAVRVATPMGDIATLNVLGAGKVFGELALVTPGSRRTATVVALEPAETLTLSREQFDELRLAHPGIDHVLVDLLAVNVTRLSEQLLEALFVPVDKRILRRLIALAEEYGQGKAGTVVPLTQEDLATMAGTTRPTANRILHDAEQAGAVRVGRARVEIIDPAKLARRAR